MPTILIVDDQEINRKILSNILKDDFNTITANDGKEALEILNSHRGKTKISAVLLDIVMPVMDGYAVLDEMQRDASLSKIPVIVTTQSSEKDSEWKALSKGAADFALKPYNARILKQRLINLIHLQEVTARIDVIEKDHLTGIYNRDTFYQRGAEILEAKDGRAVDIVCLDIQQFKLVNETYSRAEGDKLLRFLAGKLEQYVQKQDGICARFNADTFMCLLFHEDDCVEKFSQRINGELENYPVSMKIVAKYGVYTVEDRNIAISAMCDRAELAARQIKGQYNQDVAYYDDKLRQQLLMEQWVIDEMENALEKEQFQVYFQPKYELSTEHIAGAEALVRWIHPEKGFLSPGIFIPLFEKNGFITKLDQYVWEKTCQIIADWVKDGGDYVPVSVNVSRKDIYDESLPEYFENLVRKYGLTPKHLHLEITESAYTENTDQLIRSVRILKNLGFEIEMDDFGSGYSSLNMLSKLPINVLKLDMKFMEDEKMRMNTRNILGFIISIAKWMDFKVVAEGVETAEQVAALRKMDCDYVQGFYYAKPMPLEEFTKLLRSTETAFWPSGEPGTVKERISVSKRRGKRKMLIVDDSATNRAVLAHCFENEYTIVETDNGATAYEYLLENYASIEIVLLDLIMPIMDGFEFLKKAKRDHRFRNIPVIVTSQTGENSELRALQYGAADFVSKPYNTDLVACRVFNVVESYKMQELERADELKYNFEVIQTEMEILSKTFDVVRLVDPVETKEYSLVNGELVRKDCCCYAVWEKNERCHNCISIHCKEDRRKHAKFEFIKQDIFYVMAKPVIVNHREMILEIVSNVTDRLFLEIIDQNQLIEKIQLFNERIYLDGLTGAYNREYLDEQLFIRCQNTEHESVSVAMIDIDNFKHINDTYGHSEGDVVLKGLVSLMKAHCSERKGDFVARYGGDEFTMVFSGIGTELLAQRMETIRAKTREMVFDFGEVVSVSIGVHTARIPADMRDLMKRSDRNLYEIKNSTKDGCFLTSELEKQE